MESFEDLSSQVLAKMAGKAVDLACGNSDSGVPECERLEAFRGCHLAGDIACPRERLSRGMATWFKDHVARGIPARILRLMRDPGETTALRAARSFLSEVEARILVLAGGKGTGKTWAATWVVAGEGRTGRFVDAVKLARVDGFGTELDELERVKFLAIDDLGVEYADTKGALASRVDGLINARYANDVRTVITTNLKRSNFAERYGSRVMDRIAECGRYEEIAEPSMRGK